MLNETQKRILVSVMVLSLFILLAVGSTEEGTDTGTQEEETTASSPGKNEAMVMARQFLKKRLKAPATADFPFESYEDVVTKLGDDKFRYKSHVDSENSFGAKVRTYFEIVVKYVGDDKWRLISLDTWK